MIAYLRNIFKSNVFDKNIKANIVLRVAQIISQLLIIILVGNVLSKVEQGYYFALNSYAALSVFFELGFGFVIMQFIAHESADVQFEDINIKTKNISKISSLFKFSIKWFATVSTLYLFIIFLTAPFFFNSGNTSLIQWQGPLFILSIAIGLNIFLNGVYSFLDGCRMIYYTSTVRAVQVILFIILFTLYIYCKLSLYAYGLALLSSLLISAVIILRSLVFKSIRLLLLYKDENKANWFLILLPLQWRIALSWAIGYFIFQIPNLFAFKYCGAIVSGKLTLSINIMIGISTVSGIWVNTRIPIMANYVAKKDFKPLNMLFKSVLKFSFLLHFLLIIGFIALKLLVIDYWKLFFVDRLLPTNQLIILLLTSFIGVYTNTVAGYARSSKEEPLMFNAIASALITMFLCYYFLRNQQVENYLLYNLLLYLFIEIPWFYLVYKKYRYEKYIID